MKKLIALSSLSVCFLAGAFILINSEASARSEYSERALSQMDNRRKNVSDYAERFSRINSLTAEKVKQKSLKAKKSYDPTNVKIENKKPETVPEPAPAQPTAPQPTAPTAPIVEQPKETVSQPAASEYKNVMTSLFWVGEGSGPENGYISNAPSYWDGQWQKSYGGVDSPNNRCGYKPCAFTPKENPFYFALPYGERDPNGGLRSNVKNIPWHGDGKLLIKNRWIEIKYNGKTTYAQWQDVGPNHTDDFDYVFGNKPHKNTFGVKAGLDVSPAVWDYLGMKTNSATSWRFIDESQVPAGPWKEVVTTSKGYAY
jgi:hypothetical protein